MWSTSHSITASLSAQQVWDTWRDLADWPSWDSGVEWVRPAGGIAVGDRYTLKPSGGPAVTATIVRSEERRGFTDVTRLPLCTLEFDHHIEPTTDGVRITHRATFRGLASPLFRRVIGAGIARDLPETLTRLATRAASR